MRVPRIRSIYEYTSFRKFLADFYESHKAADSRFSHRTMAKLLGFSSPNFVKLVMDGERNLGKGRLSAVSAGLGLRKKESEYFSYLVFFDQAKTSIEKNVLFAKIAAIRSELTSEEIPPEQFEYYSEWYHCVIRELVQGKGADIDFKKLGAELQPPIGPRAAQKSVTLLEKLGLIKMGDRGTYEATYPVISTRDEVNSHAIRNYHKQMIQLAGSSLDTISPPKREVSSATTRISESGFRRIKRRIQEFRLELLQIAKEDLDVDRVYQLNMQFFPVGGKGAQNDE